MLAYCKDFILNKNKEIQNQCRNMNTPSVFNF